jgi:hypothetical protein
MQMLQEPSPASVSTIHGGRKDRKESEGKARKVLSQSRSVRRAEEGIFGITSPVESMGEVGPSRASCAPRHSHIHVQHERSGR